MDAKINPQGQKVVDYLEANPGATIRDLFINLEINSPAKRISELRKLGLIITEKDWHINKHGEKKRFCRYYLRKSA